MSLNLRMSVRWGTAGLWVLLVGTMLFGAPPRPVNLTRVQIQWLEQAVLPAFKGGDSVGLLAQVSPVLPKWSDAHLAAADSWLAEHDAPPMRELVGRARLLTAEQGIAAATPKAGPREIAWTVETVVADVRKILESGRANPAFAGESPRSMKEYEELFWKMHVLENELNNATRLAQFARAAAASVNVKLAAALPVDERSRLQMDFNSLDAEVLGLQRDLRERDVALRVDRLAAADDVLSNSTDLKERFRAAFALDLDGYALSNTLGLTIPGPPAQVAATPPITVTLPADRRTELARRAQLHLNHGASVAGNELIVKSRSLFVGLHWWLRGRYGAGPAGYGLLKGPQALTSPQAQFALFMPTETPVPTNPLAPGPDVPLVDRRHHYLWQFETRQIKIQTISGRNLGKSGVDPSSASDADMEIVRNSLPPDLRGQAASATFMTQFW